jgi:hypothetical protein
MRRLALLPFAFLLAAPAVSPAEKEDGFVRLWDGKSFDGWKYSDATAKSWKIEGGLLVLTGGGQNLITTKEYENFILRLEWGPEKKGYNSGLFLRGGNQINLAQSDCGRLFTSKKTRPVPDLHRPPGYWNEWEVVCDGPKVSLKVNGKLAWEIDDFRAKKGTIGLQAEGAHIDFRNLRIKEIKK